MRMVRTVLCTALVAKIAFNFEIYDWNTQINDIEDAHIDMNIENVY